MNNMTTQVKKISIRESVERMIDGTLLLPAIQRDYVWKRPSIEMMFDSILRGYPINTLMFWRINNISSQNLDFYRFLHWDYVDGVSSNPAFPKAGATSAERLIVIDGQQRLSSLYIGLYGSYATEKGKPTFLYLRLDDKAKSDEKVYDFRFLSSSQVKKLQSNGQTWLKMNDLTSSGYNPFANYQNLINNPFAAETMKILINLLDSVDYLHYYDICGYGSIDDVLEIFTRTNNSGTPLSKGDLLLSVMTSKWTSLGGNARDYVKGVIDEVKRIGYRVDKDWVIKCILVLFGSSVKMRIGNFSSSLVNGLPVTEIIYNNQDEFKKSVVSSFKLIKSFGLIEKGLSTKLAVIPIVHFIYKFRLWGVVNKSIKGQGFSSIKIRDYRHDIRKWLFRAIALNLFEAGTDEILTKAKGIVDKNSSKTYFPYLEMEHQFSEVLSINKSDTDKILNTPKKSAFPILNIIYCEKGLMSTVGYDMDHTHPAVLFSNLAGVAFSSQQDEQMAKDGVTYNSVRNLQLLQSGDNKSKNKMKLKDWLASSNDPGALMDKHCIPNVSLEIADFKNYIDARSVLLKNQLDKYLEV